MIGTDFYGQHFQYTDRGPMTVAERAAQEKALSEGYGNWYRAIQAGVRPIVDEYLKKQDR